MAVRTGTGPRPPEAHKGNIVLPQRDNKRAAAWGWRLNAPDVAGARPSLAAAACGALLGLLGAALITAVDYFTTEYVFTRVYSE